MALNIFPRRTPQPAPAPESTPIDLPVPSATALQAPEPPPTDAVDPTDEARKRTRRGTRGGRGRRKPEAADAAEAPEALEGEEAPAPAAEAEAATETEAEKPAPRARRTRRTTAAAPEAEAAEAAAEAEATPPAPARGRSRCAPAEPVAEAPAAEAAVAVVPEPVAAEPAAARREPAPREPRQEKPAAARPGQDPTAALIRAIEQQNRQIEHLARAQEDLSRKLAALGDGRGAGGSAPSRPARVGVFVDAANIELACDRLRARFDWGKILALLTKDRQLVRAVAYSPVHDDPNVSIETQRFAEPFLDKGYKLVTKPFKRFADGTIKANVDIEICLDVVNMLDRLDVVCLVSGDGDFQPLVQYVESRGVRCEVVAVGQSTASQLRQAADQYIDLGQRLKEIRI